MAKRNFFKEVKAYRRKHPKLSQQDAIQKLSKAGKKKVRAPRKVAGVKKKAKAKVKVKARPKKGTVVLSIGRVSMGKIRDEHTHQEGLNKLINRHRSLLTSSQKLLTPKEKAHIRREIKQYGDALRASKKHVSVLKRSI